MIGLIDGVRLYNDLHMKPLAPRLTLYIAQASILFFTYRYMPVPYSTVYLYRSTGTVPGITMWFTRSLA
jgi:hypothetical protein